MLNCFLLICCGLILVWMFWLMWLWCFIGGSVVLVGFRVIVSELIKCILLGVIFVVLLFGDVWVGVGWFVVLFVVGMVILGCEYVWFIWCGWCMMMVCVLWGGFGFFYIGVVIVGFWFVCSIEEGFFVMMVLFGVVWVIDIGVYVFGWLIGGLKIVFLISLLKIWVGLVGGIVFVVVVILVVFMIWIE